MILSYGDHGVLFCVGTGTHPKDGRQMPFMCFADQITLESKYSPIGHLNLRKDMPTTEMTNLIEIFDDVGMVIFMSDKNHAATIANFITGFILGGYKPADNQPDKSKMN